MVVKYKDEKLDNHVEYHSVMVASNKKRRAMKSAILVVYLVV